MVTGRPATQHTLHCRPRSNLAVRVDRAEGSPPTCSLVGLSTEAVANIPACRHFIFIHYTNVY